MYLHRAGTLHCSVLIGACQCMILGLVAIAVHVLYSIITVGSICTLIVTLIKGSLQCTCVDEDILMF